MQSALSLGATMYMPATRADLWDVVKGEKYPQLRSVVICLEDAVVEQDVAFALTNLQALLLRLANEPRLERHPFVSVRPRHLEMARTMGQWPLITQVDGMVLPKFGLANLLEWQKIIPESLMVMPTLESAETFDMVAMRELRQALLQDFRPTLALRIGGNDLLGCLGLRRPVHQTIYRTPIGQLIANLSGQFLPFGFSLSAPVFEHFSQTHLLEEELQIDIQHGLSGKTIIHPSQIELVHRAYQVEEHELIEAKKILDVNAKAVFECHGSMLELTTHRRWAQRTLERATMFGIKNTSLHLYNVQ